MFPRPIQVSLISLGIALSTLAVAAGSASASVPPDQQTQDAHHAALVQRHDNAKTSSLAGTTTPRQDLRSPDARDAGTPAPDAVAEAQQKYYTSYGNPQPIQSPVAVASPGSGVDWLPIGLAAVAALLLAGVGVATVKVRRRKVGAAF